MYFAPSEKSKAILNDWHQTCVEAGSNNQPAWNKVFNLNRRNSLDYHVMTKDLYPHGYLLEQRGFFANDQQVCSLHSTSTTYSSHCHLFSAFLSERNWSPSAMSFTAHDACFSPCWARLLQP